jgi:hypothetical protein
LETPHAVNPKAQKKTLSTKLVCLSKNFFMIRSLQNMTQLTAISGNSRAHVKIQGLQPF